MVMAYRKHRPGVWAVVSVVLVVGGIVLLLGGSDPEPGTLHRRTGLDRRVPLAVVAVPSGLFGLYTSVRMGRRSRSWWRRTTMVRPVPPLVLAWLGWTAFAFFRGGGYDADVALRRGLVGAALGGCVGLVLYLVRNRPH